MEGIEKKEEEIEIGESKLKKGMDFRFELALFLILGFLLGVVIKTEASKRITIGFNDNEIASVKQGFDFEKIKQTIAEENENIPSEGNEASPEAQVEAQGGNQGN